MSQGPYDGESDSHAIRSPYARLDQSHAGWVPAVPINEIGTPVEHKPEQSPLAEAFLVHLNALPFPSDDALFAYVKQSDIDYSELMQELIDSKQVLHSSGNVLAINARFDTVQDQYDGQSGAGYRERLSLEKPDPNEWLFAPMTSSTFRIMSPASILGIADSQGRSLTRRNSKVQTFMSPETGDLIWYIDPKDESKFVAYEPIFEQPTREEVIETVPLVNCTFDQLQETLSRLAESTGDTYGLPVESVWNALSDQKRIDYLKGHIVDPDKLGDQIEQVLPTATVPGEWQGQYRYGVRMIEEDINGEWEVTTVFIYKGKKQDKSAPATRTNKPKDENWYADVTCASGTLTTYMFGDPDLKGKPLTRKPVFYAYAPKEISAEFQLDFKGQITAEYPQSNSGVWKFGVGPKGTLVADNGIEYPYGFWEGVTTTPYSDEFNQGFCVAGDQTIAFLESSLSQLGLNQKEKTDFITYWFPVMQKNQFNLIRFLTSEYTDKAKFSVTPQPDVMIRIFMVFKKTNEIVVIPKQTLTTQERRGFTVVEWGGANLDELV